MALSGILTVKNILITFLLIGMLTALWRAAGTIPSIVCYAAGLIAPSAFLLLTFLLNCLLSFLTGTSFGTAATMGSVCMTIAMALGLNPVLMGGAILSGVYFGDRCSPVSTSALLVAELTRTDIFDNIRVMLKTAAIPFLLACLLYGLAGLLSHGSGGSAVDVRAVFSREFRLGLLPLLPAALVLLLALLKVNVRWTMLASIACALLVCVFYQGCGVAELLPVLLRGYRSEDAAIAAMLDGGGISSMLKVGAIVCLSSAYSGIFRETGLLDFLKTRLQVLAQRHAAFPVILATAIPVALVACNQTLTIVLTCQLCEDTEQDRTLLASHLENSAVVVAPLVPWSIAGAVPLATVGAPTLSLLAAVYLYLLPLCTLLRSKRKRP